MDETPYYRYDPWVKSGQGFCEVWKQTSRNVTSEPVVAYMVPLGPIDRSLYIDVVAAYLAGYVIGLPPEPTITVVAGLPQPRPGFIVPLSDQSPQRKSPIGGSVQEMSIPLGARLSLACPHAAQK